MQWNYFILVRNIVLGLNLEMILVSPLLVNEVSVSLFHTYGPGQPNSELPMPGSPLRVQPQHKLANLPETVFGIILRPLGGAACLEKYKERVRSHCIATGAKAFCSRHRPNGFSSISKLRVSYSSKSFAYSC